MTYQLVYDIAADSQAPRMAFLFGTVGLLITGLWIALLRMRARRLHGGVKFLGAMTVLLFLLGTGLIAEQKSLAGSASARSVEGPISNYWTRAEHLHRSGHSSVYEWEGFAVSGVSFVYARNVEQNAFHNAGRSAVYLADGAAVRIRYVPQVRDGRVDNQITRLELGNPWAASLLLCMQ